MINDIDITKKYMNQVKEIFLNHDVFEVTYEDLTNEQIQEHVLNKIQLFLNVKPQLLISPMKRQNPECIQDLIVNYDEVALSLTELGLKEMIKNN